MTVRPPLREPARLDGAPTSRTDSSPYAELARRLPTYRSAVLGAVRGDELPSLQRVGLRPDPGRRGFRLQVDATPGTAPGPASLLLHRHDDQLWDLRTAGAVGRVAAEQDGWLFLPERSVAGTDGLDPVSVLRTVRRLRRTARGYLDRRHLDRPAVSWAEHRAVARTAA